MMLSNISGDTPRNSINRMKNKSFVKNAMGSLMILLILVFMIVLFSIISPGFASTGNFYNLLQQATVVGIITVGQTFVIISKGIDLSQGSIIGFTCIISSIMIVNLGLPIWVGLLVGLLMGTLVGIINGTLIAFLNVPSFIATLGTSGVFKAAALLTTGGNNIYDLPDEIREFGNANIGKLIPVIAIIMIAITIIAHILLKRTKFGRYTYAIGSNEQSAKLSGIKVKKNLFAIYVMCGVLSAIAGVIMLCRLNSGVALAGQDYQMNSISAVVIGGGSLFGGEGTIVGAIIGAAIMTVLSNGMQLIGVSTYVQELLVGVVLIAAVLLDNIRRKNLA